MTAPLRDYRRQFELRGRVAGVTGGVGILGRHFCCGLADHGARVAVAGLDASKCAELADELASTYVVRCLGLGCDITAAQQVRRMAAQVETERGPVAVLHNNAATKGQNPGQFFADVKSFDIAVWRQIMAGNLDGAFLVALKIGERMAARGHGSII